MNDSRRYRMPQALLGWVNLALTAPGIYLYLGLPLVMRQHGWSGADIGLFQLAGIPVILKFLLATPIERWKLGRASYLNWGIVLLLAYAIPLLALAAQDIRSTPRGALFALALAASLLGTWADIPVNALAIQYLPVSERIRAGAIRSAATSLGAIVGGGLMLVLQTRAGWAWPFWMLAGGLLSAALLLLWLRLCRHAAASPAPLAIHIGFRHWLDYFSLPAHRAWIPLLLLYFPLTGTAWVYLKPLLLDQGFQAEQVAWLAGVIGGLMGVVGSLAGARLSGRYGVRGTLPAFAAFSLSAVLFLALGVAGQAPPLALIGATLAIAVAMGAAAGLVFSLMMQHTRDGMSALDYGIQSSLFAVTRTVLPLVAGVLLDGLGYVGMLACLAAGLLGVLWLTLRYVRFGTACGEH